MTNTDEKVRENRLRRLAYRMGYRIVKSRRPASRNVDDLGGFMIVNYSNVIEAGQRMDLTLDEVEEFLK